MTTVFHEHVLDPLKTIGAPVHQGVIGAEVNRGRLEARIAFSNLTVDGPTGWVTWAATIGPDPHLTTGVGRGISVPLDDTARATSQQWLGVWSDQLAQVDTVMTRGIRTVSQALYSHIAIIGVDEARRDLGGPTKPSLGQLDALSVLAQEHASLQANLDLNQAFVQLMSHPSEPEHLTTQAGLNSVMINHTGDARIALPDQMVEWLHEHWRATYLRTLNDAIGATAATDTPSEQSMMNYLADQEFHQAHTASDQAFPDQPEAQPGAQPGTGDHPQPPPNRSDDRTDGRGDEGGPRDGGRADGPDR